MEAKVLQISAIVVAGPRYMGAFAAALGISIVNLYPWFPHVEIWSGLGMAILEGWAIAFIFRKWRSMTGGSRQWKIMLAFQSALLLILPLVATPYLLASQYNQPVIDIIPVFLLVVWSFLVAAIAPLVVAAVGYADREKASSGKSGRPSGASRPAAGSIPVELPPGLERIPVNLADFRQMCRDGAARPEKLTGKELAAVAEISERTARNWLTEWKSRDDLIAEGTIGKNGKSKRL